MYEVTEEQLSALCAPDWLGVALAVALGMAGSTFAALLIMWPLMGLSAAGMVLLAVTGFPTGGLGLLMARRVRAYRRLVRSIKAVPGA